MEQMDNRSSQTPTEVVHLLARIAELETSVAKREEIEVALRRSEARYRAVVETAYAAIITMTLDGRVESFNPAAERLFGYLATDVIGQRLTMLIPERFRSAHDAGLQRYNDTGEAPILGQVLELAGLRRDGVEFPVDLTVAASEVAGDVLFTGIIRDITERKRLDSERSALLGAAQAYANRLANLATLKADFTAMVAHELGAPIATIRGLADLLMGGLGPEDQAHALAMIRAEADLLRKLVSDVQSVASVERDDFAIHQQPISAAVLLADAAGFARTLPGDHTVSTAIETTVAVMADRERIGQVLRNLLSNAAKYSAPGTPIELRASREADRVRFEVADQGYGIHSQDLPRIFEKFGRGRDMEGRPVHGVGLGLYVSRRIVQAHGSDLGVKSAPGAGSVFSFDLEIAL